MEFKPYKCANSKCKMDLLDLKSVDLIRTPPKVDDLLLCGACGTINKVTLEGTAILSELELAMLSEDEQKDLRFAVRAVKRQLRNN